MVHLAFKVAAVEGSIGSKAIAWWTRGPFCHVELWLEGPIENALCFSSTLETGTRFTRLNLTAPIGLFETVEVPVSDGELDALQQWCAAHQGEKYDKLGIVGFVIPFGEHHAHEMFCSETDGEALEECTLMGKVWKKAGDDPWKISPNELYKLVTQNRAIGAAV